MKWGPLFAMLAMLALGAWLVWGPRSHPGLPPLRDGALTSEVRFADDKGVLEAAPGEGGEITYRLLFRDGSASEEMSRDQLRAMLPAQVFARLTDFHTNAAFRLLNITSWSSLIWIAVGFGGQLVFSCRFLIQWLVSEKNRRSTIPEAFWWLSLMGGVALFAYFVWRQDLVGVLGQSSGVVIYARNLRLIHKQRRREMSSISLADPKPVHVDAMRAVSVERKPDRVAAPTGG